MLGSFEAMEDLLTIIGTQGYLPVSLWELPIEYGSLFDAQNQGYVYKSNGPFYALTYSGRNLCRKVIDHREIERKERDNPKGVGNEMAK